MAIAQLSDVQARLTRQLDESELEAVETLLNDAELILRTRIPNLLDKIASDQIDSDLVTMIEANAVVRVLRNPDGYMQESDGNYSYTINVQAASGLLDIQPREWEWLGLRRGAYTIRPHLNLPMLAEGAIDPYAVDRTWSAPL